MLLLANIEVPNAMMTQFTADIPAAWGPHAVPRMQQVLAHPNFDRAVEVYLDGMVKAHRGHPMLNHLMSEIGRFTTVSLGLYLHAGGGLDGFRDGLTLTRLQDLIGGFCVLPAVDASRRWCASWSRASSCWWAPMMPIAGGGR